MHTFCKMHPWLAQKVCTRSAHAAVSKVSADAVLKKALNEKKAGDFYSDFIDVYHYYD